MGIDYGAKRIGIALSDEGGSFAFPEAVIETSQSAIATIADIAHKAHVTRVVMGESVDLSVNENPIASDAKKCAEALERELNVPVSFVSEVFTSQHARRQFEQSEKTRKPQKREVVDASAAALILQSYLDTNHE